MRRVVVTGYGIVSCLGNNKTEVLKSLQEGRSGIRFNEKYEELGFRSRVCGMIDIDLEALIDRKVRRFMGDAAAYTYLAMQEAVEHAGLGDEQVSHPRTGLIVGSGGASPPIRFRSRYPSRKRLAAGRAVRGHPGDGQYGLGLPGDSV